ncbi:MAG: hypothetical protein IAE96_02195 [Chitinophagaceae bacterium]|nr:hypothetical protein [Chitinophagaceae bacterium]
MTNNLAYHVITAIMVMLGLMLTVLLTVLITIRKRNQHRRTLDKLRQEQQEQLVEAAVRSEENERHRIAETLHDEVGAILSSAKLHLLGIRKDKLDEKDLGLHEKGAGLLIEAIRKVRGISHNLHSNILREFGLNEALSHFLSKTCEGTAIRTETALDENYPGDPEKDITLYRIVQEMLNNILKYAGPGRIRISSNMTGQHLELLINHNGNGLSQEEFEQYSFGKKGLGLKNIRNRITLLKGAVFFTKEPGDCRIRIIIPQVLPLRPNGKD